MEKKGKGGGEGGGKIVREEKRKSLRGRFVGSGT